MKNYNSESQGEVTGFDFIFQALARNPEQHNHDSMLYKALAAFVQKDIAVLFGPTGPQVATLGAVGDVYLSYTKMGAIDTTHLFGLDELIIFAFYVVNSQRYRKVLDAGANVGLHSIVMSRCGYKVTAFEPDPFHFEHFQRNLMRNTCLSVTPIQKALSTMRGKHEFVRVVGNTTGSHLAGAKNNTYGPTNVFEVETENFKEQLVDVDLVKIDVEGHEAKIILSVPWHQWVKTDAIVEVGNAMNAREIYSYFSGSSINLFAQRLGWKRVSTFEDMPVSYHDGSLFISAKVTMPWGTN